MEVKRADFRTESLADFGLNILIGKVDPRFDSSKELEDSFAFG